jgi:hypothetical protein
MLDKLQLLEEKSSLTFDVNAAGVFPHPVRDGISDEEFAYINKLYAKTLPLHPVIGTEGHCFTWTAATNKDGYAIHRVPKGMSGSSLVHRFLWQTVIGPAPDDPMWRWQTKQSDVTIHHKCGRRGCINLWHLCLLPLGINREIGNPEDLYRR